MFDAIDFKWNDEEKEAIKTISIKAVTSKAECEDYPSCICLKKDLLLILNLIEKQQKEKDKLEKHNKELLRKLKNRVKEVKKLTKYSLYKKEFAKLNREIEKKNKIINDTIIAVENLRQYFSEDLQPDFIRILEILKDKKVIEW